MASGAPMMVPASMATITMNPAMAGQPIASVNMENMAYCSVPMSMPLQGTTNMSMPGILGKNHCCHRNIVFDQ